MADISLVNVCKTYKGGQNAVKDFNLDIRDRELIIFVGPSGCGKSTTLRMIAGLEDISSGELWMDDCLMNMVEPKNRNLSMVFQNYAVFPHLTVAGNVRFGLDNRKVSRDPPQHRLTKTLKVVKIDNLKDRLPQNMSGGQQQRLCIAIALAVQPEVLLMDEPTSALDPISTSKIEELAMELKKDYTIVMVTHNMQQATRISDKTAFFLLGEVVEFDDTDKLFSMPSDKRTEDYITGRFG